VDYEIDNLTNRYNRTSAGSEKSDDDEPKTVAVPPVNPPLNEMISWSTKVFLTFLVIWAPAALTAAAAPSSPQMQIIERRDLPGGLVRERLRLPGFDPDEAVPAVAIHPASGGPWQAGLPSRYGESTNLSR
jgi:hypothetical protein